MLAHPAVVTTVKLLASASAIYMTMSPLKDMEKVRAKVPIESLPILCMFANGCIWTLYGVLVVNWFPLVVTNAINALLAVYYLAIMYTHAGPHRRVLAQKIVGTLAVVVGAIVYAAYGAYVLRNRNVSDHIGYLGIAVCTLMFGSPLAAVGTVVKQKSAAMLPLRLILAGVLCASLWFTFGLMISDPFVYGPNGLNLGLGLFQVFLCVYYRTPPSYKGVDTTTDDDDDDLELAKLNIGVL
ncbi:hypothetical protein SPRG_10557 [Saprolegnia parasitica CBS 223.65]|uniref:Sugar transporter SWEET1 n=1 Tax=Saprolegnia parasitica (strain CBS 223.65) TaxID=695850 RepID=A0A067C3S6_SAPPC|nr:hypothetical protein SPRG_10557 [Saprolegnia parasitica CBS 223.65]KDO23780.1 hypothetical protein SPRG_10557 [Saprolegnia parasitica CBS 223.65]|eukprot:XP_012205594.1 hypothetical protein SPRG_10557 [Saprolegnia parasitica CBS 223.65]